LTGLMIVHCKLTKKQWIGCTIWGMNYISIQLFLRRTDNIMFIFSYFYILVFVSPKLWNCFCLSYLCCQKISSKERSCTMLESFVFPKEPWPNVNVIFVIKYFSCEQR
jgi:hypothetical protein